MLGAGPVKKHTEKNHKQHEEKCFFKKIMPLAMQNQSYTKAAHTAQNK